MLSLMRTCDCPCNNANYLIKLPSRYFTPQLIPTLSGGKIGFFQTVPRLTDSAAQLISLAFVKFHFLYLF